MYWLRWTPAPGAAQERVSLETSDWSEAIEKAKVYRLKEGAKARVVAEGCAKEIERYLAALRKQGLSRETISTRGYVLNGFAEKMHAATPRHLSSGAIQKWADEWWKHKPHTAAAYLNYVIWWLDWIVGQNRLGRNVAREVVLPALPMRPRRGFLLPAEARKLLDACEDPSLKFALFCGLQAGMRKKEVIEARPGWFDMEQKLIHIQKTPTFEPKGRENRTVPMTDEFHQWLTEVYLVQPPFTAASGETWMGGKFGKKPFMMVPEVKHGKYRYRYDFRKAYDKLVSDCGLEVTFHDLRRTFASLLVSAGVSLYKVAKWLGDTTKVVEDTYGHLIPQDDQINAAWK